MPQSFKITGGARIGWTNATWPLTQISASVEKLVIKVSLLGTHTFTPDQVSAIERYVTIPVLGWGIRIHHCNPDCPTRVIFWSFKNPNILLQGIKDSGFQPSALTSAIGQRREIPMRWSAIVVIIFVWIALGFLPPATLNQAQRVSQAKIFPLIYFLFLFVMCLGILLSPQLQRLILKPSRSVGEIKPLLRLMLIVSGLLLIVFTVLSINGTFNKVPRNSSKPTAAAQIKTGIQFTNQVILDSGRWKPCMEQTQSALATIKSYISANNTSEETQKILNKFQEYRVQFIGVIRDGKKLIYCNFFLRSDEGLDWKKVEIRTDDGGFRYWQIYYDPKTGECSDFTSNGYA